MKQIHNQEKAQFKKLFEQEHIAHVEDRYKILEVFLQTESHVTAEDLHTLLAGEDQAYSIEFVRETLKLFHQFGFAQKSRFDNGKVRYEHRHLGEHHDHMVCIKCLRIIEFQEDRLEALQVQIAASQGFYMLRHKMEIYGLCADCRHERLRIMPLAMAKQGEQLVIEGFDCGSEARMRLMAMGLRIGERIEVITNQGQGPIVVALDFNRLSLGRGLADKIRVTPAEDRNGADKGEKRLSKIFPFGRNSTST